MDNINRMGDTFNTGSYMTYTRERMNGGTSNDVGEGLSVMISALSDIAVLTLL
jgi:hypothetical protein